MKKPTYTQTLPYTFLLTHKYIYISRRVLRGTHKNTSARTQIYTHLHTFANISIKDKIIIFMPDRAPWSNLAN